MLRIAIGQSNRSLVRVGRAKWIPIMVAALLLWFAGMLVLARLDTHQRPDDDFIAIFVLMWAALGLYMYARSCGKLVISKTRMLVVFPWRYELQNLREAQRIRMFAINWSGVLYIWVRHKDRWFPRLIFIQNRDTNIGSMRQTAVAIRDYLHANTNVEVKMR